MNIIILKERTKHLALSYFLLYNLIMVGDRK